MDELKDAQEFALESNEVELNENTIQEIDLLQELVDHDFSSDEATDFEKYFNVLESAERDNETFKKEEADYIIAELGPKYLDKTYLDELEKLKNNLTSFIKKHDVNSDLIKNMSETDKDKLFAIGKFLNKNIVHKINDLTFTFTISRDEYKFINSVMNNRMSYDGTEVFNLIELKNTYLDKWDEDFKKLPKVANEMFITIDIRNVVMLYHFLSKYSVKGIGDEFIKFVSILQKIADTNKLFNAYNIVKDRINSDYMIWVGAMTPMPVAEETKTVAEEQ